MSWVHIDDLCPLSKTLWKTTATRVRLTAYLLSILDNKIFSQCISQTLKRPSFFTLRLALALKLMLGEMSTIVLDGQKVAPCKLKTLGFDFKFRTIHDAFEDLYGIKKFGTGRAAKDVRFSETKQYIEMPLEKVSHFFCNPYNLERITPLLRFKILSSTHKEVEKELRLSTSCEFMSAGEVKTLILSGKMANFLSTPSLRPI